jgi:hypothetical protein
MVFRYESLCIEGYSSGQYRESYRCYYRKRDGPPTGSEVPLRAGLRSRTGALVTCLHRISGVIVRIAMSHFPQSNAHRRSPRVLLNGTIAAAIHAESGDRARAKLQSLSINGGLLQLPNEMSAGDFIEIAFHTRSGPIHGMAEMLPPTRKFQSACWQPFRFIALGDDDHRKLRMALDTLLSRRLLDSISEDQPSTSDP